MEKEEREAGRMGTFATTRKSFSSNPIPLITESLASSNPEDLVEKDEVGELEGSVEREINRSILGIDETLNAPEGESEESCNFVLSSIGSLMSEKRLMSASMGSWVGGGGEGIGSLMSEKKRMNSSTGNMLERRQLDASILVFDDHEDDNDMEGDASSDIELIIR
jgi:hypothetical protein